MHSEVEIKQDLVNHVLLSNSIDFGQKFILFRALVDCDVFDNAFIDQFFAQEQDFKLLSLKHSIEFSVFDESDAKSEPITHYYYLSFSVSRRHRVIKFYVTFLPQWKIVLELSWLKINHAILDFDKLQMIYCVDKLNVIVQVIQKMIFVSLEFEFNSDFSERSVFEKVFKIFIHFDIAMINATSYLREARKSDHVIDAIIMKNIDKVLNSKKKVDSATILSSNLQKFQNVFSQLLVNNLSEHRFYDHVILLLKGKISSFEFFMRCLEMSCFAVESTSMICSKKASFALIISQLPHSCCLLRNQKMSCVSVSIIATLTSWQLRIDIQFLWFAKSCTV